MLSAEGYVETVRASRYLNQLCAHADQIGGDQHVHRPGSHDAGTVAVQHVEWGNDRGVVSFTGGKCTLTATAETLTLRVEAANAETLQRAKKMFSMRLDAIGRRDDLTVTW